MHPKLPPLAIILGVAGIIPFALLGIGAVGASPDSSLTAVRGLVGYGAVILAFLGGVHWGFTLGEGGGERGGEPGDGRAVRARLTLGVLPSLVGWLALFASIVARPVLSLAILIAGLIATVVIESRAQKRDLMPGGYMAMRWAVSVVVVAILTTVLVLRLVGGHVLL